MSEKRFVTHDSGFGTKLREKHEELEHNKIRDVELLRQFLTNEKRDERKLYTILTESIPLVVYSEGPECGFLECIE